MAENQLNRQLAAGIRAAQQGDRERARELLEGVLRRDKNNEQGWIWMAAVVESNRERRMSLERVLKINPNNQPAQEALNSMVGVLGGGEQTAIDYAAISAAARTPAPVTRRNAPGARGAAPSSDGETNYMPFLFGGAIVVGLLLIGAIFLPSLLQAEPTPTPTLIPEVTVEDLGPTVDPNIPTVTLTLSPTATFEGSLADLITNTPLGATFTPTEPPPPTDAPEPTATLPSLDAYSFLLLASQGSANPGIYRLDGNGAGLASILPNVDDFDYDPRSGLIVFTRLIFVEQPTLEPSPTREPVATSPASVGAGGTPQSSGGGGLAVESSVASLPDLAQYQMFITNINSIENISEVTSSALPSAFAPAISPDGRYIAFTTDVEGDTEIYLYNVGTRLSSPVTSNSFADDTDPDWLPDGSALVFSSDRVSASNNDLFTIDPFASDPESTVEQVVQGRGRNLQPQWSPRGNYIAFLNVNSGETTVRLASTDGSSVRDISSRPDWLFGNPSWTPDGNYVLYTSGSANAPLELRVYSPTTRTEQTIRTINLNVLGVVPR